LGISLIDIEMDELVKEIDRGHRFDHPKLDNIKNKGFDSKSIDGALKIYNGFKAIVNKYKLDGITVRCFDLLEIYKNTGCLGLSLLNDEGIVAGCEGDIPALISMAILHYLTDEPVFMLGVGIKGKIKEGEATIFKLSRDGKEYFVSGGEIIENLNSENLCRTQIRLRMNEDVKYFLQNSLGNVKVITISW
jgi:L-fucose isomerase-like protein